MIESRDLLIYFIFITTWLTYYTMQISSTSFIIFLLRKNYSNNTKICQSF